MNTGFKEWMIKREGAMDTTGMYTPKSGVSPAQSSHMGYATTQSHPQQQPAANPNIPWQIAHFQSWYNSNRGNWNDVIQAAQSDPNVRTFVNQMAKSLAKDGLGGHQPIINGYGEEEFDLDQPTRMGQFADQLENMVRKVIPTHGSRHRDPSYQPPQGARPSAAKASTITGDVTRSNQGLTPLHSQLQDMQSRVQDQNTSQLINVVRTLLLRIDDIERRLGSVTSAA